MARKIARGFATLLGVVIGIGLVEAINRIFVSLGMMSMYDRLIPWVIPVIFIAAGLVCGIISFIFSPSLITVFSAFIHETEAMLADMALVDIFFGVVGLIVGLVIAFLLSTLTASIPFSWVRLIVNIALYVMFGYLGWSIVTKRKGEINVPSWFKRGQKDKTGKTSGVARPKILDTSVIIDGRIADICQTGIIEGTIIVPGFVLQELRHIADSADSLKRNRGRRGLDILNKMQQELDIPIKVNETDYDDIAEVDAKLIKLAYDMGGRGGNQRLQPQQGGRRAARARVQHQRARKCNQARGAPGRGNDGDHRQGREGSRTGCRISGRWHNDRCGRRPQVRGRRGGGIGDKRPANFRWADDLRKN